MGWGLGKALRFWIDAPAGREAATRKERECGGYSRAMNSGSLCLFVSAGVRKRERGAYGEENGYVGW